MNRIGQVFASQNTRRGTKLFLTNVDKCHIPRPGMMVHVGDGDYEVRAVEAVNAMTAITLTTVLDSSLPAQTEVFDVEGGHIAA